MLGDTCRMDTWDTCTWMETLYEYDELNWQTTTLYLTTLTHWYTVTDAKFTLIATGSNMTDLQITQCLRLVGTLWAKSNMSNRGFCKRFWAKFPRKKQVALGKGILFPLGRDWTELALTLLEKDFGTVVHGSVTETEETETVELGNWGKSPLKDEAIS